jgi:hypothetical protein
MGVCVVACSRSVQPKARTSKATAAQPPKPKTRKAATPTRGKPALMLRVGHEWVTLKDVMHFSSFFDELDAARSGYITLVGIVEYMERMDAAINREVEEGVPLTREKRRRGRLFMCLLAKMRRIVDDRDTPQLSREEYFRLVFPHATRDDLAALLATVWPKVPAR